MKHYLLAFYLYVTINVCHGRFGLTEEKVNDKLIGNDSGTISSNIQGILTYLLGLLALISVVFAIKAGFQILTAAGDEEKVKSAKKTLLFTLLGLLVIWGAWVLVYGLTSGLDSISK